MINQRKAGSILSYLQMAIGIIVNLVYTPVMTKLLGQSEYGLYNTVSSTMAMLSILSLGFNASYIKFYSVYKKNDDKESIFKLNGIFLIIFLIIGLIAFCCGLFLSFNLNFVFDKGLSPKEYEIAKTLMLILTINLAISFPMSIFQNIISAQEKFVFLKLLSMLKTVVGPLVSLPILLMGFRSIALVSVTLFISIITDICYLIYAKGILKIKFKFGNFEKGLFKELFVFSFFIAINIIVDQVNNNMGKFLLGRYVGTIAVGTYSIGYTVYHMYTSLSTAVSGVFTPKIHHIVNNSDNLEDEKKKLTDLFIKVGRIQFIILALVCSGFAFFGKSFIPIWVGTGYEEAYYVALLLLVASITPLMQNLGICIQRAKNKHKFRSLIYLCMAFVNIVLTTIFSQKIGVIGAALGTTISLVLANGIVMNIYYHKECNINMLLFWRSILRLSLGLIIPIVFGIIMCLLFDFSSITNFLLGVLVYFIVYCISMWYIGINKYEKLLIIDPLKKILKKIKREKN